MQYYEQQTNLTLTSLTFFQNPYLQINCSPSELYIILKEIVFEQISHILHQLNSSLFIHSLLKQLKAVITKHLHLHSKKKKKEIQW